MSLTLVPTNASDEPTSAAGPAEPTSPAGPVEPTLAVGLAETTSAVTLDEPTSVAGSFSPAHTKQLKKVNN